MKHLVLLGGGHAHLKVLRELAVAALPDTRVTLVSPFERPIYSGMVPGWVAGHCSIDDCSISLSSLTCDAGVAFIESSATVLDVVQRKVLLANGQTLQYDVLSVDSGAEMDRDAVVGAHEFALFVRPVEYFVRLWGALLAMIEHRTISLVVVGGGAVGVELALAIKHRLGSRARVALVSEGGAPMPSFSVEVQQRVRKILKRFHVVLFEDRCVAVGGSQMQLGKGNRLLCDVAVMAIGARPPYWLVGSGLALDERGFIATGPTLQSLSHPEVFAAGDVASRPDLPHPRNGVYAVRAGTALAKNLRRFVMGKELSIHRPSARFLNVLACGERYALATWGRWSIEGRWVWHWKNRIDRIFMAKHRRLEVPAPASSPKLEPLQAGPARIEIQGEVDVSR